MFFKEISYEKNFRVNALDQFIYEKISAKVELNDTDNPMNAITMAKEFVNEQGSKACQYPEQHIQEKYIPEELLPEIQVEKQQPLDQTLEQQIRSCTTLKVLKAYQLLVKKDPILQEAYNQTMSNLTIK